MSELKSIGQENVSQFRIGKLMLMTKKLVLKRNSQQPSQANPIAI